MKITYKSLHHVNIVFIFDEKKFVMPENSAILSVYPSPANGGANFADDVTIRTKVLDLPRLKLQISVEPNRLRIDDNSEGELKDSMLLKDSTMICEKLFPNPKLTGFGFNFDLYYQFENVLMIKEFFSRFIEAKILEGTNLLDLGVQFTLEKEGGLRRDTYFLKVTAPLELAVHVNSHFFTPQILDQTATKELLEKCYEEVDGVIENVKF